MKNLDIEKLDRQNIYKVPESFFGEMQLNVLAATTPKKEAKIIKMNWAYSAAAAIALIFGVTFFVNQKNTDTEIQITQKQMASKENINVNNSLSNDEPQNKVVDEEQNTSHNLPNVIATNQKVATNHKVNIEPEKSTVVNQEKNAGAQNPDVQVDQILANFSSADLADLGKNTEQDVYLDLYN